MVMSGRYRTCRVCRQPWLAIEGDEGSRCHRCVGKEERAFLLLAALVAAGLFVLAVVGRGTH